MGRKKEEGFKYSITKGQWSVDRIITNVGELSFHAYEQSSASKKASK